MAIKVTVDRQRAEKVVVITPVFDGLTEAERETVAGIYAAAAKRAANAVDTFSFTVSGIEGPRALSLHRKIYQAVAETPGTVDNRRPNPNGAQDIVAIARDVRDQLLRQSGSSGEFYSHLLVTASAVVEKKSSYPTE